MKFQFLIATTILASASSQVVANQAKDNRNTNRSSKVAALAIDRDDGYYYGWSFDQPSREEAERTAIEGAKKFGAKNPSIVLVWSGSACGAYRTVGNDVGNAYGWGVAATKEAADRLATEEAQKRSGGKSVPNFVWACNSKSGPIKVEYDAGPEIIRMVNIKGQIWAVDNLQVSRFRNGDEIPHTMDEEVFKKWLQEKKPASFCYTAINCEKQGRLYNGFALTDPRGLAPNGWRVPSKGDFERLISNLGGPKRAGPQLRVPTGWVPWAVPANNSSGFSALAGYYRWSGSKTYWEKQKPRMAFFWSSTLLDDRNIHHMTVSTDEGGDIVEVGNQGFNDALPIRLIKE